MRLGNLGRSCRDYAVRQGFVWWRRLGGLEGGGLARIITVGDG